VVGAGCDTCRKHEAVLSNRLGRDGLVSAYGMWRGRWWKRLAHCLCDRNHGIGANNFDHGYVRGRRLHYQLERPYLRRIAPVFDYPDSGSTCDSEGVRRRSRRRQLHHHSLQPSTEPCDEGESPRGRWVEIRLRPVKSEVPQPRCGCAGVECNRRSIGLRHSLGAVEAGAGVSAIAIRPETRSQVCVGKFRCLGFPGLSSR
jgi:hypothetical protein